jgi:hypothetical protein
LLRWVVRVHEPLLLQPLLRLLLLLNQGAHHPGRVKGLELSLDKTYGPRWVDKDIALRFLISMRYWSVLTTITYNSRLRLETMFDRTLDQLAQLGGVSVIEFGHHLHLQMC